MQWCVILTAHSILGGLHRVSLNARARARSLVRPGSQTTAAVVVVQCAVANKSRPKENIYGWKSVSGKQLEGGKRPATLASVCACGVTYKYAWVTNYGVHRTACRADHMGTPHNALSSPPVHHHHHHHHFLFCTLSFPGGGDAGVVLGDVYVCVCVCVCVCVRVCLLDCVDGREEEEGGRIFSP